MRKNEEMSFLFLLVILVFGVRAGAEMENMLQTRRRDLLETTPVDFLTEQTTIPSYLSDNLDDSSFSESKGKTAVEYVLNDAYPVQEGLIPKNYKNLELPPVINRTEAVVTMVINRIRGLNEDEGELTVELDFEMAWSDGRLNRFVFGTENLNSSVSLNPNLLNRIWHPHIYIDQLVKTSRPSFVTAPAQLSIHTMPRPLLHYAVRRTVVTSCTMDFHFYPSDLTTCKIDIKSYMYGADKLHLRWPLGETVKVSDSIVVHGFKVIFVKGTTQVNKDYDGAKYSTLSFSINLKRELSFHVTQIYIPSLIFIIISWCTFFLPNDHATERIGTAIVSLLSLMVMLDSIGQKIPKVTYLTAVHVWMLACIFLVFLPLVEVFFVFKLWDLLKRAKKREEREETRRQQETENLNTGIKSNVKLQRELEMEKCDKVKRGQVQLVRLRMTVQRETLEKTANALEITTPWLVIAVFVLFNAIYWPWLVTGNRIQDLEGYDGGVTIL